MHVNNLLLLAVELQNLTNFMDQIFSNNKITNILLQHQKHISHAADAILASKYASKKIFLQLDFNGITYEPHYELPQDTFIIYLIDFKTMSQIAHSAKTISNRPPL